jgi:hypothetical protein
LELYGIISWRRQLKLEQVLGELDGLQELRFCVSHLTAGCHDAIIHSLIFKVFLNPSDYDGHVKNLFRGGTLGSINLEKTFDDVS